MVPNIFWKLMKKIEVKSIGRVQPTNRSEIAYVLS